MSEPPFARRAWTYLEPVHDVVYFAPGLRDTTDAAGLRGFWMAYFAMRAAPLGAVGVDVVTAVFYGFHRERVARAIPEAWERLSPQRVLTLRAEWVRTALRRVLGENVLTDPAVADAADIAWAAAQACDCAGRPLAAANQALPRPAAPALALWQAATTLREHRGDGHNAVLLARGIGPAAAHLIKAGAGEADARVQQEGRGFPPDEWASAVAELRTAGLLAADGTLTAAGRCQHAAIEEQTDAAAAAPWQAIGDTACERLLRLLEPLTGAVERSGILPVPSPTGLVP